MVLFYSIQFSFFSFLIFPLAFSSRRIKKKESSVFRVSNFHFLTKNPMKRLVCFFNFRYSFRFTSSRAEDSSGTTVKGMTIVPTAQRHALLIGIDGYPPPVSKLNFCVKDMQDLAVELEKVGFPKENIHLMVDSSSDAWKPTSKNIVQQVKSITDAMNSDDFLFVAFSGHGVLTTVAYLFPSINPAKQFF